MNVHLVYFDFQLYAAVHISHIFKVAFLYMVPGVSVKYIWYYLYQGGVLLYICKTQIDVQPLIDVQSSNHVRFLRHRHLYFRSTFFFSFCLNSQIGVQFSNLWLFLTFSIYSTFVSRFRFYFLSGIHYY